MTKQRFSAELREAMWLAYSKKCVYTRELLDVAEFHIDHVVPESLAEDLTALSQTLEELELPQDFDLFAYSNLVPAKVSRNLQKSDLVLAKSSIHFYLGIAASKVDDIEKNLAAIQRRKTRGKALILLQQALEQREVSLDDVSSILRKHSENPGEIFHLLEGMNFVNSEEIRYVQRTDLDTFRDRRVRLGQNDHLDGITLINDRGSKLKVRTCREYENAVQQGYFPSNNYEIKSSVWFKHQCGLLNALDAALTPKVSHISEPRVGILDLDLIPASLFPWIELSEGNSRHPGTYQDAVSDGTFLVRRTQQNLLVVEEPKGMGQQLIEVARADFTGSGYEEMLLFEYCYATHGTLGFGGIRTLRRTSSDDLFEDTTSRN